MQTPTPNKKHIINKCTKWQTIAMHALREKPNKINYKFAVTYVLCTHAKERWK